MRAIQNHFNPGRGQISKINQNIRTKTSSEQSLEVATYNKDSVTNTNTDREYIHTNLTR